MSNRISLVVFTAAGASRAEPIKLPTMAEFFQEIMDDNRIPYSPRITNKQYFKFVIDSIYGSDNNYDLERIMGALYGVADFTNNDCWKIFQNPVLYDNIMDTLRTSYQRIIHINGQQEEISSGIQEKINKATDNTYEQYKKDAIELIYQLEDIIREKYSNIQDEHLRLLYQPFFDILLTHTTINNSNILPIFTINYDMSIDWFFDSDDPVGRDSFRKWSESKDKQIHCIDGFVNEGHHSEWNQNEYKDINDTDKDTIYIPYFKLHGSLYWEACVIGLPYLSLSAT